MQCYVLMHEIHLSAARWEGCIGEIIIQLFPSAIQPVVSLKIAQKLFLLIKTEDSDLGVSIGEPGGSEANGGRHIRLIALVAT